MTTIRLLTERSRNAIAALAALGLVTVIAVVAAGLALAGVHAGSDAGAQRVLAHSAARSAAVRVTTHLADDAADQESAARALVSRVFPAGTVDVHTAWNTLPTAVTGAASDLPVRGVFAVRPDLLDLASITDGEWPADEDSGAALQEDAAEALGLGVGDEFTTGTGADEVRLTVEALWRATDPADPVWFADPLAGSGRAGEAVGPLVVGADVFAVLPTQRFVTWIITATPAALAAGDRAGVAEAIRRLPAAVETSDGVEHDSSEVDGGLGSTLAAIASAQRGAVSVATSALTIVALLSLVALAQLSRVVAGARRRHTGLLRARGLSLSQLAAVTALEGVIVGALGAVVGAGVVISVVGTDTLGALALIAVAAIGATVACLLAVVIADDRAAARESAGAVSPVPFLIAGGVVAAAAGLASWRLFAAGSTPATGADAVAATAPALALVASAALGTVLLIPTSAALARAVARTGRAPAVLAARRLSVRAADHLVPVLAVAIAVSSAVFATGIATTWAATQQSTRLIGSGTAVVVDLPDADGSVTADRFARLDAADDAAALLLDSVTIGSDTVPLLGVDPRSLERVLPEAAEAAAALATTSPRGDGSTLDPGASAIRARVTLEGDGSAPTSTFDVGVWLADIDSSLVRVPLVAAADTGEWTAELPQSRGAWRVLAVESRRTGAADRAVERITVTGLAGSSAPLVLAVGDSAATARALVRPPEKRAPLPVVITTALAARLGTAVGDSLTIELRSTSSTLTAVITAVTPPLPGTASRLGLGTDLAALDVATLADTGEVAATNAVWIATSDPADVSAAVARASTSTALVRTEASTSFAPVLDPALTGFWLAAAAAGLLALVALSAFLVADVRGRRGEVAVLRALGFSRSDQSRVRSREQATALAFSIAVGVVGGALATALTVAPFLAAAVPGAAAFVTILPSFHPVPALAFVGALALVAVAIVGVTSAHVRREAATAVDEEADS